MDVFDSEKRLLGLLQGKTSENLLYLAIESRLDVFLARLTITSEIVELMKKAAWIEDSSRVVNEDELRRTINAHISGIAGFFLYRGIPIDAMWTACNQNADFVRGIVTAYMPEEWGRLLATSARGKGIPTHLIEGMLVYAMFDVSSHIN